MCLPPCNAFDSATPPPVIIQKGTAALLRFDSAGMNTQPFTEVELPPGTAVVLHRHETSLILTWRSIRGLHIVRTTIPLSWCRVTDDRAKLAEAVEDFRRAVRVETMESLGEGGDA